MHASVQLHLLARVQSDSCQWKVRKEVPAVRVRKSLYTVLAPNPQTHVLRSIEGKRTATNWGADSGLHSTSTRLSSRHSTSSLIFSCFCPPFPLLIIDINIDILTPDEENPSPHPRRLLLPPDDSQYLERKRIVVLLVRQSACVCNIFACCCLLLVVAFSIHNNKNSISVSLLVKSLDAESLYFSDSSSESHPDNCSPERKYNIQIITWGLICVFLLREEETASSQAIKSRPNHPITLDEEDHNRSGFTYNKGQQANDPHTSTDQQQQPGTSNSSASVMGSKSVSVAFISCYINSVAPSVQNHHPRERECRSLDRRWNKSGPGGQWDYCKVYKKKNDPDPHRPDERRRWPGSHWIRVDLFERPLDGQLKESLIDDNILFSNVPDLLVTTCNSKCLQCYCSKSIKLSYPVKFLFR